MILQTSHGTGDAYMTLAFAKTLERMVGEEVIVLVKPEHAAISDMFPEVNLWVGPVPGDTFQCHPSKFVGDISQLAYKDFVSHADLWRCMLNLPINAPMARGKFNWTPAPIPKHVFIIDKARSIPNSKPEFWTKLADRLTADGWHVTRNLEMESLQTMFEYCANAEWVIGPQCGVMAVLCHALFKCRKTFVTPALEGLKDYPVKQTFPYMYVTKFASEDYDVEEYVIEDDTVELIANGPNAKRLMTGQPVRSISTPLSIGDFVDRYTILMIKWADFDDKRRASIAREYFRYRYILENIHDKIFADELAAQLAIVNMDIFKQSETIVPDALNGKHLNHDKIIALNKRRVELKNEINRIAGSSFMEVKSYYEEGH